MTHFLRNSFFVMTLLIGFTSAQAAENVTVENRDGYVIESYFEPQEEATYAWDVSYQPCDKSCNDSCSRNSSCGCETACCKKGCKKSSRHNHGQLKQHENYRLQIGDQLFISLYGYSESSTGRDVTVDPTGKIAYLFVEPIPAVGKTIDEVKNSLQEKIVDLYPNVLVTITATALVGDQYTIMGEVYTPGTKPLQGNMTVLKAVAEAGGFPLREFRFQTIDYADLDRSFLARNGDYIPVNFDRLIRKGDLSEDVPIESGDYIYIPSLLANEIYILGEVGAPLVHQYFHSVSLREAISWAGGLNDIAGSRILIIRGSLCCPKVYMVDFLRMLKCCCPDFWLEPGDIVYVPCRKFQAIKDLITLAKRTFVGSFFLEAGSDAFRKIEPSARDDSPFLINPGPILVP